MNGYFLEPLHSSYRNLVEYGFSINELFSLSGRLAVIGSFRRINSAVMKIWLFKPEKFTIRAFDNGCL